MSGPGLSTPPITVVRLLVDVMAKERFKGDFAHARRHRSEHYARAIPIQACAHCPCDSQD